MRRSLRLGLGKGTVLLSPLVVAALAAGLAPAAPGAAAEGPAVSRFRVPAPTRTVLKNGLTLLVLERRSVPLVQFQMLIKAGSVLDPKGKEGAADLTARLLKRGTRHRDAQSFSEQVEFVGGTLEAAAGSESTWVMGEFASRDLETGFDLLADMVQGAVFSEAEFERERSLALAEITAGLDNPSWIVSRAFRAWLFGSHPYGRPTGGSRKSISALTREDVVAFHRAYYRPNNAILAVVGDVDAKQAASQVERHFSKWERGDTAPARIPKPDAVRGRRILLLDKPDGTQSQIQFGSIAVPRAHPDRIPLTVANAILGSGFTSWLVDEVRVKRGLTYGIGSSIISGRVAGRFVVSTFSKNATVLETINVSLDQVRRLRAGSIPDEDLDKARSFLSGLYPLQIESPDALAGEILEVEFYGLGSDYINNYQKRIRAVDSKTVKRVVARYLSTDDLAIVVVGPAAELEEPLSQLGKVTVRPVESAIEL